MTATYDYIVVGSGSAGGVIAARLSENGRHSVACVEAGTAGPRHYRTIIPAGMALMIEDPKVNWCYYAQPDAGLDGRRMFVPTGRIVGGTSAINGVIYNRGQRHDYDGWAARGCNGWSYADVLPYFKRIESTAIGSDDYRGRSGPIKVTVAEKTSPFFDLFTRAAEAVGLPRNADYSGESQYGVAMAQITVDRGRRNSTATAYLQPARRRTNLTLITGARVTSLVMEGRRCVGLRMQRDGGANELRAAREVIVCAGAIGSPKLLELSGIGDPAVLGAHGIPVVQNLPGVGEGLRDHFGGALQWEFAQRGISLAHKGRGWRLGMEIARYATLRNGFLAQGWCMMRVFDRSHDGVPQADFAILANPYLIETRGTQRKISAVDGFYLWAQIQRPESAGSVHVQSTDPLASPAIRYNFLSTENDRRIALAAFRKARKIVAAPPLAATIRRELEPSASAQTDDEIVDYLRRTGATTFHPVGTCKMGHDAGAVVDDQLRVRGIAGLRVADASIMPMIISGNTSIPTMMIGEKCADMVLADARDVTPS